MSLDVEALLGAQYELQGRVARATENLKKAGTAKLTTGTIESRIKMLDSYWTRFEANHDRLRALHWKSVSDHEYAKADLYGLAEESYITQRGALLDMLESLRSRKAETRGESGEEPAGGASRRAFPRIQLPHFDGKYEDWPAFKDLFTSLITKESSLSPVEKLHYLKTSLKGEAEQLVRNLPTTGGNFDRAWSMLVDHFENKRLLVRSCFAAFTALPKMKTESVADLRKLVSGMVSTVGSMESIGRPINNCTDLFVYLVVEMLDVRSRREWETSLCHTKEPPAYETLKAFLEGRLRTLEALQAGKAEAAVATTGKSSTSAAKAARSHLAQKPGKGESRCVLCQKAHYLLHCPEYLKKQAGQRKEVIESNRLCGNCLGRHPLAECASKKTCVVCGEKHHTTTHDAYTTVSTPSAAALHTRHHEDKRTAVLLATARVQVRDRYGRCHPVRALVDTGSEVNIVAETLVQRLRLPRSTAAVNIFGVGGGKTSVSNGKVTVDLSAGDSGFSAKLAALVLPRISACGTRVTTAGGTWSHLRDLRLADPDFCAADPVELLLGADAYALILEEGLRKGEAHEPIAQQTSLGWIVFGAVGGSHPSTAISSHLCSTVEDLSAQVRRFWEQEEEPREPQPLTADEQTCEDLFASTHTRAADGRYTVRLPIAGALPALHDSRLAAIRVLKAMERRFDRDSTLQTLYRDFLAEYEHLMHMSPAPPANQNQRVCYLPHHGVLKTTSATPKIRVVFNGSSRLPSGETLNNHLLAGPNLLPALPDVLLRWRRHRFAMVSDIEKMYRQIQVHPDDRNLQRIVWRNHPDQEVVDYRLNTVTYGLACAPFLAIRTLRQLAMDEEAHFPLGAAVLNHDVYVDDIVTGADTVEEACALQQQLISLCRAGGFPLRKWAANDQALLADIPVEHQQPPDPLAWRAEAGHSTLGLQWHPKEDCFSFRVQPIQTDRVTKRLILSQTARLFDPLGWLAPVVVRAKILLQATWLQHREWDQPLALEDEQTWLRLQADLPLLEEIRLPRWLGTRERGPAEIHGFADASERAYAAVVYIKSRLHGKTRVSLLLAKTRVAPILQVSLPRLELCAAALLTKVVKHVQQIMDLREARVHLWSDSTVALAWIQGHPSRWKTFVANRVSTIQRALPDASWHHLASKHNPADCASRGISPRDLLQHPLWWQGPPWLAEDLEQVDEPGTALRDEDLPEQRAGVHAITAEDVEEHLPLLTSCSTLHRLLRITAWCRRWLLSLRSRRTSVVLGPTVGPQEIEDAQRTWIRVIQEVAYRDERRAAALQKPIPRRSALVRLNPFIDDQGTLRVGGRLKHALLSLDERHPIILPEKSRLTGLIIDACHRRTLHGGVQLTLGTLRQRFWIPGGRRAVKQHIHRCLPCVRWRGITAQPLMGALPRPRVKATRPFTDTGVDYAGPIHIRTSRGRGQKSHKGFLAVFVCLAVKAVHLEVVSDYTTEAFLAAFRRFVSRRGLCRVLYSDRGTNFIGADNQLRQLFRRAITENRSIAEALASDGVQWRFNPPAAPHFGGIWEAAVKAAKHHVRRVIGDATLTYEELTTFLAQVEACLNSRPLQALSDDPDDLAALTPGHFLVGTALNAVPEPSLTQEPMHRITRWQHLQKMRDHFWDRWSREYLHTLMERPKWFTKATHPAVGDLCLVRTELMPPSKWPLARITKVHRQDARRGRGDQDGHRPHSSDHAHPAGAENHPAASGHGGRG